MNLPPTMGRLRLSGIADGGNHLSKVLAPAIEEQYQPSYNLPNTLRVRTLDSLINQ
ncbi:hypothetical protein PISMIDRAFT_683174 [Pisolithus microcarpus 441]|uniref:Uncharacterized protein n=1 Tax=Pisolithus microcarpus 441 TaxID=765257 RepID=A0A0C9ZAL9_9AGAM|nr:hypothetical protein PISMIDRAFT_683174 [Pisolithus microcarpus 441]